MVKLKYCEKCACDMPVHFRQCPSCGAPNRKRLASRWWAKGIAFLIFLAALYVVVKLDWNRLFALFF